MSENEEGHRFRERASGELALVFIVQGEGRGGMEEREKGQELPDGLLPARPPPPAMAHSGTEPRMKFFQATE